MFKKYNIEDLFIAEISYMSDIPDINIGGLVQEYTGWTYYTVLRKAGEKYIDLQNPKRNIRAYHNGEHGYFNVEIMEPLSDFINKSDKTTYSKKAILLKAKEYYQELRKSNNKRLTKSRGEKTISYN